MRCTWSHKFRFFINHHHHHHQGFKKGTKILNKLYLKINSLWIENLKKVSTKLLIGFVMITIPARNIKVKKKNRFFFFLEIKTKLMNLLWIPISGVYFVFVFRNNINVYFFVDPDNHVFHCLMFVELLFVCVFQCGYKF